MRDWIDMDVFEGLDLSESFVLSWRAGQEAISFEIEFMLTASHPSYSVPSPNEFGCFALGSLIFPRVTSVEGLMSMNEVRPAVDATGELDYGHIDTLIEKEPGLFELSGDFGVATIRSSLPKVYIGSGPSSNPSLKTDASKAGAA